MDDWGSQALVLARKTIILVKNHGFYGYFKVRQQMTYTSRTRNLHCSSENSKTTIKHSIFEDFYGFSTSRSEKSGRIIHKKCAKSKKLWFFTIFSGLRPAGLRPVDTPRKMLKLKKLPCASIRKTASFYQKFLMRSSMYLIRTSAVPSIPRGVELMDKS